MTVQIDQASRTFALLIGINDYSIFDSSVGLRKGANDLTAGLRDVQTWYRLCLRRGIAPENIHVLTTPRLEPDTVVGGVSIAPSLVGEATLVEIERELGWLKEALERAQEGGSPAMGLFTFSGHGDFADGHLALCPSDVRMGKGLDPERLLGFRDLQARVRKAPSVEKNLTMALDCCHARRSLSGRSGDATPSSFVPGDRVLMAARRGETAWQCLFDGEPHGALTWAVSVVTDQYNVGRAGTTDGFTVTYGDLCDRGQKLLDALSINQDIKLVGSPELDRFFFLESGEALSPTRATRPDRNRHGIQVDPDWTPPDWTRGKPDWVLYRFRDRTHQVLGAVLVAASGADPSTNGRGYTGPKEYWDLPAAALPEVTGIEAEAGLWGDSLSFPVTTNGPVYTMDTVADWGSRLAANSGGTLWAPASDVTFGLSISSAGPPVWSWVQGANSQPPNPAQYVVKGPVSGLSRTAPTAPPTGSYTWYSCALTGNAPTIHWDSPAALSTVTPAAAVRSASLAAVGNTLYMAVESPRDRTTLYQSSDGHTWQSLTPGGASPALLPLSGSNPQLVVLGETLHVCFYSESERSISWAEWSATAGWQAAAPIVTGITQAPPLAATVADGVVYVAHWDGTNVQYVSRTSGTWSRAPTTVTLPTGVVPGATPSLSLASFQGTAYLGLVPTATTASSWVGPLAQFGGAIPCGGNGGGPGALAANHGGSVLLFVYAVGQQLIGCASTDGSTWFTPGSCLLPTGATFPGAIGSFQGGLMLIPFYGPRVANAPHDTMNCFYGIG